MLEEFGKMLGHIMGLKAMNQEQLALDELRAGYKSFFGLDVEFIHGLKVDNFVEALTSKTELTNRHLEAIAQAVMTEGELLHDADPVSAAELREKALALYLHLEESDSGTFSLARKAAVNELKSILGRL
jgi:hypothetical protein